MRDIHDHGEYHKYTSTTESSHGGSSNEQLKGISINGKMIYDASKDSNGVTILKCLLVTILCVGGVILPIAAEMETLGTIFCIFGSLGLSVLILKNV